MTRVASMRPWVFAKPAGGSAGRVHCPTKLWIAAMAAAAFAGCQRTYPTPAMIAAESANTTDFLILTSPPAAISLVVPGSWPTHITACGPAIIPSQLIQCGLLRPDVLALLGHRALHEENQRDQSQSARTAKSQKSSK